MALTPFGGISPYARPHFVPGGFTPPAGCVVWAKVDTAATGVVSTWSDSSGNSNDFSTAIGALTGVASVLNGHKVVRFLAGGMNTPSINISNRTYFIVASISGLGTIYNALLTNPASPFYQLYVPNGGNYNLFYDPNNFDSGLAPSGFGIIAVRFGATAQVYLNGNPGTSNSISISSTNQVISLGWNGVNTTGELNGDVAEVFVFNSSLSDANMNLVGNYIAGWSSIPWTNI